MNIALGIILIFVFTRLGKKFADRFIQRSNFYNDFYQFNLNMSAEMTFSKRTLIEIEKKSSFKSLFADVLKNSLNLCEMPNLTAFLSGEEIEFTKSYFDNLGKTDGATQLKMLNSANILLKKNNDESKEIALKYGKLSTKLSFLFGLMAFILII